MSSAVQFEYKPLPLNAEILEAPQPAHNRIGAQFNSAVPIEIREDRRLMPERTTCNVIFWGQLAVSLLILALFVIGAIYAPFVWMTTPVLIGVLANIWTYNE